MDPQQYQEILNYSQQGSKLQVSVNSSGNVVMVPVVHLDDQSPTDLDQFSQHVTTHIITPEQLQEATEERSAYQQSHTDDDNLHWILAEHKINGGGDIYQGLELGGPDENLADLQPEDSDEEEDLQEERMALTPEQQKLEFMAAVNLVPPAVLEEIQRRQKLCRAEYGNWWDRQHSTDFCLVPKSSSVLNTLHTVTEDQPPQVYEEDNEYPLMTVSEDQTQVAAGPDAESMVEQITYLTSWPATASPAHTHTVEVVTTPTSGHTHQLQHVPVGGAGATGGMVDSSREYHQITFQSIDDYSRQ